MLNSPKSLVVVFPAAIIAERVLPTAGNLVATTRCGPILPNV